MDGRETWSRYWASGQTHSCFAAGKPFDSRFVWAGFLDSLAPGARGLDLACGAGALTRLAVEHPHGVAVTGADYADALVPVEGARMVAGAALEALPFEDGVFDAAISQFGLEYADTSAALAQAARVLAPGGRLGVLAHARHGEAAAAARTRIARAASLIAPDGLAAQVRALGEARASGQGEAEALETVRQLFAQETARPLDETTHWAMSFLAEILNKRDRFTPPYLIENARTVLDEVSAHSARQVLMT
ncbi:MAG: methyltransferase domain-containing protein [Oceanicaulis sp.]|nr:methyltransferase domain-containing protein [Oceanicaulis sp.]